MSLASSRQAVTRIVEVALGEFFEKKQLEAQRIHPHLVDLVGQVKDLTMRGGKKSRPFMVWLGYQSVRSASVSTPLPPSLIQAMMAIELFQSFALIHDDIMDQDRERRGAPSVHEYFRALEQSKYKLGAARAKHFGESLAMLAGDVAFGWAGECITETHNAHAIALFHLMSEQTIYGQTLDVAKEYGWGGIDTSHIIRYKTAYYSAARPLQIGAQLANCSAHHLNLLETFGLAIGQLFQLRDDFLDGEISQSDLDAKSAKLLPKSFAVVKQLHLDHDTQELFYELAKFVVERTS